MKINKPECRTLMTAAAAAGHGGKHSHQSPEIGSRLQAAPGVSRSCGARNKKEIIIYLVSEGSASIFNLILILFPCLSVFSGISNIRQYQAGAQIL